MSWIKGFSNLRNHYQQWESNWNLWAKIFIDTALRPLYTLLSHIKVIFCCSVAKYICPRPLLSYLKLLRISYCAATKTDACVSVNSCHVRHPSHRQCAKPTTTMMEDGWWWQTVRLPCRGLAGGLGLPLKAVPDNQLVATGTTPLKNQSLSNMDGDLPRMAGR